MSTEETNFGENHCHEVTFDDSGKLLNPIPPKTAQRIAVHASTKIIGDGAFKFFKCIVELELHYGLNAIGSTSFQCCRSLKLVAFPKTLNTIGRYAFANCIGLEEISFSQGQQCEIGDSAFEKCQSLRRIVESTAMISIGSYSFCNCKSLEIVEFSTDIRRIGDRAFENCDSFQRVSIPSSLASELGSIGDYAFAFCRTLAEVELPETLSEISKGAFSGCILLKQVTRSAVSTSSLSAVNQLPSVVVDQPTALLPPSLKVMKDHCFGNCLLLCEIQLPQGLKAIGSYAFRRLTSLSRISIPDSVEVIGDNAFEFCVMLAEASLSKSLQLLGDSCFQGCSSLERISVPSNVKVIRSNTFVDCVGLVDVDLHEGLREIGVNAFLGCTRLKRISVPATTTIIHSYALRGCTSLVDVEFREGLLKIASRAFQDCKSLCTVSFPATMTTVESCAFAGCRSLLGVEVPSGICFEGSVFRDCLSLANISVPFSAMNSVGNNSYLSTALNPHRTLDGQSFYSSRETRYESFLVDRYASLPIHKACYHASSTTVDELRAAMIRNPDGLLKDRFGLSPFHVLASSTIPRPDLLGVLLDELGLDSLSIGDNMNSTMMNYLMWNLSSQSIPLIKAVIKRAVIDKMARWGMEAWRLSLSTKVESSLCWEGNTGSRWQDLDEFKAELAKYAKIEMTSLLEQALWKAKIGSVQRHQQKTQKIDREWCRLMSGADAVIQNVIGFLWNNDSTPHMSLIAQIFPHDVSWMQRNREDLV